MQLILKTDLEKQIPAKIEWNNDELKTELSEKLKDYKNLVVTDETIQSAKGDRAELNKLKDNIDGFRKEVKKACLAPYEAVEKSVKELTAMIDEPIGVIDAQIKELDSRKKQEKRDALTACYAENIGALAPILPLERIYNPKWENLSVKFDAAKDELLEAISKARNDIGIIQALQGDYQSQMIDTYLRTLDMSAVLAEKNRLEAQDAAIKQMQPKAPATAPEPEPAQSPEPEISIPKEETKTIRVVFYDTTVAFRAEIKALTDKHHIKYGGIK